MFAEEQLGETVRHRHRRGGGGGGRGRGCRRSEDGRRGGQGGGSAERRLEDRSHIIRERKGKFPGDNGIGSDGSGERGVFIFVFLADRRIRRMGKKRWTAWEQLGIARRTGLATGTFLRRTSGQMKPGFYG